ncbi:MAG: DAK2 domain-containing protein, partial [Micromonosporaceae bacterium]
ATPEPVASDESVAAAGTVRKALEAMLATVTENESTLGRLDSIAGDGDHGRGMVRGLRAACEAVRDTGLGAGQTLRTAGAAWADTGAGSSGVLWGAMLQTAGSTVGDETVPDSATLARAVREAADTVSQLGGATAGDKTLLDALLPFADALAEATGPVGTAWQRAAQVAADAAEATKDLLPKVGRARPLGEKSLGTPDPGAVSLAMCLRAVGGVLETECGPARADGGERA